MSGFAVEQANSLQIVAAWTVPPALVPAAPDPYWRVLGEYFLPVETPARLEATGQVSDAALELTVRLWDTEAAQPVNGAVVIDSTSPVRVLGDPVTLPGNRTYQVHAQCVGAEDNANFALMQSATITD